MKQDIFDYATSQVENFWEDITEIVEGSGLFEEEEIVYIKTCTVQKADGIETEGILVFTQVGIYFLTKEKEAETYEYIYSDYIEIDNFFFLEKKEKAFLYVAFDEKIFEFKNIQRFGLKEISHFVESHF